MQIDYVSFIMADAFAAQYFVADSIRIDTGTRRSTTARDNPHNIYGPAIIARNSSGVLLYIQYFILGKTHNEHGPAVTHYHSSGVTVKKIYCVNNKRHNEHIPSVITYHSNGYISLTEYYLNDKRHREHGPALTFYDSKGAVLRNVYFKHGRKMWDRESSVEHNQWICNLL